MIDPREHRRARRPRPVGAWLLFEADRDRRLAGEQLELALADARENAASQPEPARGDAIDAARESEANLAQERRGTQPC